MPSPRRLLSRLTDGQHRWAIRRRERAVIEDALARFARGRLVDVGCGTKPYASFLEGRVASHLGVDRPDTPHGTDNVDVIGGADSTGLPDGSADTVLLSQVLEHVEDPAAAIAEAYRLLETDGTLILSTNFAWHLHEAPRDFFRFSEFALRYLFELHGFEVIQIAPIAGTWLTIGEEVAYALRRIASRHIWFGLVALPAGHIAQLVGLGLERLSFDPVLTSGHLIVGRKVAGGQVASPASSAAISSQERISSRRSPGSMNPS